MEHGAAWVIRNSEGIILVELKKSFAADYGLQTEFRACFEALDWCFSQQLSPSQTSYRFLQTSYRFLGFGSVGIQQGTKRMTRREYFFLKHDMSTQYKL